MVRAIQLDPTPLAAKAKRLLAVDVLRGIAALWVVLHHCHVNGGALWDDPIRRLAFVPLQYGYLGITLFLVISGFCIHLTVAKKMGDGQGMRTNWGRFWKRRFFRLYPPYLAAIVLSVGILVFLSPGWFPTRYEWVSPTWDLLTHLTLTHNLFKRH